MYPGSFFTACTFYDLCHTSGCSLYDVGYLRLDSTCSLWAALRQRTATSVPYRCHHGTTEHDSPGNRAGWVSTSVSVSFFFGAVTTEPLAQQIGAPWQRLRRHYVRLGSVWTNRGKRPLARRRKPAHSVPVRNGFGAGPADPRTYVKLQGHRPPGSPAAGYHSHYAASSDVTGRCG